MARKTFGTNTYFLRLKRNDQAFTLKTEIQIKSMVNTMLELNIEDKEDEIN